MKHFLKSLFGSLTKFTKKHSGAAPSRPLRARLGVECLEQREVLSVATTPFPIIFSPDGLHSAQVNVTPQGSQVIEDGRAVSGFFSQGISQLQFSPTGDHLAFVGNGQGNQGFGSYTFEDGHAVPNGFAVLGIYQLQFSNDGLHLAFAAGNPGTGPVGMTVIEDGRAVSSFSEGVTQLQFSKQGDHLAFVGYGQGNQGNGY